MEEKTIKMDILEEIEKLKEKLGELELKVNKGVKIKDIAVGEQFVYCGHNYTKLNKENFCIIDDYDDDFMGCQFDPMSNNYDESLIRYYINSDRFIEKLGLNKADIKAHYKDDLITLLSKKEYEKYEDLIEEYGAWWATRSAYPGYANYFCYINYDNHICDSPIDSIYGVRLGFKLDPNTFVEKKLKGE